MHEHVRQVTERVARLGRGSPPVIELTRLVARELRSIWPTFLIHHDTPWHMLTEQGPVVLRFPHRPDCDCTLCVDVRRCGERWVWSYPRSWAYPSKDLAKVPTEPATKPTAPKRRASERKTLPPMSPLGGRRRFVVTIFYQEPTYAARRGIEKKTYRGSFRVAASSEAEAEVKARKLFEEAARTASVSWVREIVRTECRAA